MTDYEEILDMVCELCAVDKQALMSKSRAMPYPQVRGFFWCILRKVTGYSNNYIAEESAKFGHKYSIPCIGSAITRISHSIYHERLWRDRWDAVVTKYGLEKKDKYNNKIDVTIYVPKGMKQSINVEIKER